MKFKILTYNNRAGIVADAMLLYDIIYKNLHDEPDIMFIDNVDHTTIGDVGIWIQNPRFDLLQNFRKNIWFINEEWAAGSDLSRMNLFDYVVVKSEYAKKLLQPIKPDVICLPLISYNFYDSSIPRSKKFIHFNGRAIQKNTEVVMKQSVPITVVDLTNRFVPQSNIDYINQYLVKRDIKKLLNQHSVHICPSLYESWGHYLFEGLSTGAEIICSDIPAFSEHLDRSLVHFIPTIEKVDTSYHYCEDHAYETFCVRKAFFLDEIKFKETLENFEPIGKEQQRRDMYHDIMLKNSKKLIEFFKNI